MLFQRLFGRMTEQLVLKYLDHRLSPARCGDEEALEKLISSFGRELLIEMVEFTQFQVGSALCLPCSHTLAGAECHHAIRDSPHEEQHEGD
jgi:hypothetical protein